MTGVNFSRVRSIAKIERVLHQSYNATDLTGSHWAELIKEIKSV